LIRATLKGAGLLLIGLTIAGIWWYVSLPDGSEFARANPQRTAMMRYREAGGIRPRPTAWQPLSRIAPALRRAVVVAEDANFYHHHGIDWEATWDAVKGDWREHRFSRGGSTITQQLAKNLYLEPKKTVRRKAAEALIAMKMERRLGKPRLLELYLNVVEWGRGVYGAEAASRRYFGKPAAALTIDEAAWLAAILPAPLRYEQRPRTPAVVARAASIQRYVERQLGGQASPPAPPELPPLPPAEEEDAEAPPPEPSLEPSPKLSPGSPSEPRLEPHPEPMINPAPAPLQPGDATTPPRQPDQTPGAESEPPTVRQPAQIY